MKNKRNSIYRSGALIICLGLFSWSCTSDQNEVIYSEPPPPPPDPEYVGSATCAGCHSEKYESFLTTGHPYILSKVVDGQAPYFPFTSLDYLPSGYTWNDLTYTIGGYNWKGQYIDANGYIVTGNDVQWNFETEEAVAYHPEEVPGTKMYDCGKCHTTGWVSVEDGGTPQDNLPGMAGGFYETGVQCEACHGMGNLHVISKSKEEINRYNTKLCQDCHYGNEDHSIAAENGFILNHEQYDEMIAAGHSVLSCNDCHDPHNSVEHGQTGGIIKDCIECHTEITKGAQHNGADCITCHLPYVTKTAVERTIYQADIMTHIFKINTAADGEMFNEDGTLANGSSGVTLDFVCYRCHRDLAGRGGSDGVFASRKSMESLSNRATGYHD